MGKPGGRRLGFAVKVLGEGGLPSHDTRRWQSGPHLSVSLERLTAILAYLDRIDVRMYRMATALAPYASHPDLPQFHRQVEECSEALATVGEQAERLAIRLSSHPGQYTVLNSEDPGVRAAAAAELEVQASLFDAMGLPADAVIVIHLGGGAGGLAAAADRFVAGFETLSAQARARLVIENDDRVCPLTEATTLARRLGIPCVFDIHHHRCLNPDRIPDREALDLALATWPADVVPKLHFSSPRLDVGESTRRVGRRVERKPSLPDQRSHADLVDPMAFEHFVRDVLGSRPGDVMLEAKGKDLALLRLREQLLGRGFAWERGLLVG